MEKLEHARTHSTDDTREKAVGAEQIEQEQVKPHTAAKGGFGYKAKRHCARFWWVHIIIFCIVFLIIALCLVYVAMPKIAQHGVNESYLELTDLEFLEPAEDSLTMTQKVILQSPSMYTPTLDPFSAGLYLITNGTFDSVQMVNLELPRIHAHHPKSNVSIESQRVSIVSLDEVTKYATAVLTLENVESALVGKTDLHEGKLPTTTVHYNTTLTYKGLNGLKGFNVTNLKLNLTEFDTTKPNLEGFAYIPNPSVITVAMGNVSLTLSVPSVGLVGIAYINDMTIRPGNNTLPMSAIVNQTLISGAIDKNGYVDLHIIGNSSIYNGQHLTYYEDALKSNELILPTNVEKLLTDAAAAI